MERKTFRLALSACLTLSISSVFAQMQRDPRLDSLLKSTDSVAVKARLDQLLSSDKEHDVNTVVQYYGRKNDIPDFERVRAIAIQRFPLGTAAYIKEANESVAEKDPVKKEALVKALTQKFPGQDNAMYYFDVAQTYADQTGSIDLAKVSEYARKCSNTGYRSIIIEALLKKGQLELASRLARESMDTLKARVAALPATDTSATRQSPFQAPGSNPRFEYNRYAMLYARILVRQGRPADALSYAKDAYDNMSNKGYDMTSAYVDVLLANDRLAEAYPMMEKFCRLGMASPEIKAKLRQAYISAKGSAAGYDELMASIKAQLRDSANARIVRFVAVKSPAPAFTLKNIKGQTVSLNALKGKVVILDFWATWCGPCKKSFPAMQMAVNRYKDDRNVVFLFIDTWERVKDPLPGVKGFIDANKYTFNVLLDAQDPVTKKNNVVESYQVSGIPTKFIIDRKGEIAYRLTGFSGGDDAAVEELSAMIESARS
ncbi:MAG: TlpA family protein disulfide reductase [Bacteroidetes bacterium]|nr:TlpA family protein disulfide reductase [Bacteroidota bacterium]